MAIRDVSRWIRKARRYLGQRLIGLESASAFQEERLENGWYREICFFVPLLKETTAMGLFVAVNEAKGR